MSTKFLYVATSYTALVSSAIQTWKTSRKNHLNNVTSLFRKYIIKWTVYALMYDVTFVDAGNLFFSYIYHPTYYIPLTFNEWPINFMESYPRVPWRFHFSHSSMNTSTLSTSRHRYQPLFGILDAFGIAMVVSRAPVINISSGVGRRAREPPRPVPTKTAP